MLNMITVFGVVHFGASGEKSAMFLLKLSAGKTKKKRRRCVYYLLIVRLGLHRHAKEP
jgi:hypothetical protein